MLDVLARLFTQVMEPCFALTGNWWASILLFTLIVKVVLMPLSLWCQYNSIVMVRMMPALNRIKVMYFGDQETIGEKQAKLNKEYHYHPMLSLIPLAVQVVILFGLVEVIHGVTDYGAPGTEFLGLVPVEDGGLAWLMPVLAALSAVVMGEAQNRINPLQKEQTRLEKNTTNGLSVALSFVLGIYVAAGMAFYWICSNLLSILVQVLCNVIVRPEKYVDYQELAASKAELDELNALSADKGPWWKPNPLARRERADYKRFFGTVNKHIVFYSERSGYYKYFQGAIEWLLANSTARIHYVTNDPKDNIFELAKDEPRIMPYYIGEKRAITLMMKMDADVVVLTLDDLDNYYIKRSYVRKDVKYVHMPHHMTSMHLTTSERSYDHYDAMLSVGPHQIREIRRIEQMRDLPPKQMVECGYDLLDRQIAEYAARNPCTSAPSCSSRRRGRRTTCSTSAGARPSTRCLRVGSASSCARIPSTSSATAHAGRRSARSTRARPRTGWSSTRTSAPTSPSTTPTPSSPTGRPSTWSSRSRRSNPASLSTRQCAWPTPTGRRWASSPRTSRSGASWGARWRWPTWPASRTWCRGCSTTRSTGTNG